MLNTCGRFLRDNTYEFNLSQMLLFKPINYCYFQFENKYAQTWHRRIQFEEEILDENSSKILFRAHLLQRIMHKDGFVVVGH